jgi:hypothetical protein
MQARTSSYSMLGQQLPIPVGYLAFLRYRW